MQPRAHLPEPDFQVIAILTDWFQLPLMYSARQAVVLRDAGCRAQTLVIVATDLGCSRGSMRHLSSNPNSCRRQDGHA